MYKYVFNDDNPNWQPSKGTNICFIISRFKYANEVLKVTGEVTYADLMDLLGEKNIRPEWHRYILRGPLQYLSPTPEEPGSNNIIVYFYGESEIEKILDEPMCRLVVSCTECAKKLSKIFLKGL